MSKSVFIRSTRKRRAGIVAIKHMIDEAHRFRESWDLEAYSNIIADIELARVRLDPEPGTTISEAEKTAIFYRSYGKITDKTPLDLIDEKFAFLDARLKAKSSLLTNFENQVRRGFEVEMFLYDSSDDSIEFI
jgi:hypothetical protein